MKYLAAFTLLLLFASSCSVQNVFSRRNDKDKSKVDSLFLISQDTNYQHIIRRDCHLSISVWNHDDISIGSVFNVYNSNEVYGKWITVDAKGTVVVPILGEVKLDGLTVIQATDTLEKMYAHYIKDPIVVLKLQNLKVTVIGEVIHPGVYPIDVENITLLEVIGKSGGFDFYAKKTHIKVLRQIEGIVYECDIDLTREYTAQTRNIKIISGDIVVVPTRSGKMWDKKMPTLIPIASVISAIALLYTVFHQ